MRVLRVLELCLKLNIFTRENEIFTLGSGSPKYFMKTALIYGFKSFF